MKIARSRMKILLLHNRYRNYGGEDGAVAAEARLLQEYGNEVVHYDRSSEELDGCSSLCSILTGIKIVWASRSFRAVTANIPREKPHIATFPNIVPLLSPAAYDACAEVVIPVVQTLHNYRLLCPGGL